MSLLYSVGLITHAQGLVSSTGAIATSSVSGGTAPYTIAWTSSAGASTNLAPNLNAKSSLLPGRYTVTITDSVSAQLLYTYNVSHFHSITLLTQASDPGAGDSFGTSCSIDGEYMVVGAPVNGGMGAAYTFKRSDTSASGTYSFLAKLQSPAPGSNYGFGRAVAISGNTVAVGESGEALGGKVWIFFRTSDTNWTSTQAPAGLTSSDRAINDLFGNRVAIDGDYIIAGAQGKAINGKTTAGAAYVFKRTGQSWAQEIGGILNASDPTSGDNFGCSVSISGAQAAVGAFAWDRKTPSSVLNIGAVYVFSRTGSSWTQGNGNVPITASDPTSGDVFGAIVSISGDYLVAGAQNWDQKTPAIANLGAAYVFVKSTSTQLWSQQAILVAGDGIANVSFGASVSIAGANVIVGAPTAANGSVQLAGRAYLYSRTDTTWHSAGVLLASDPTAADTLGRAVSITDKYIAVGANQWDRKTPTALTESGAVYTKLHGLAAAVVPLAVTGGVITHVAIFGQSTGSISAVTASGGVSPYTYTWSGGLPAGPAAKTGLSAGTYTLTLTDAASTTPLTQTYIITENPLLVISGGTVLNTSAPGGSDGAISATAVSGGSGTYVSFAWSNSGAGSTAIASSTTLTQKSGLSAGSYTLVATDSVGGTVTRTFVVASNPALSYTGGVITPVAIFGQSTGAISAVTVTGGSSVYPSIVWKRSGSVIPTPTTGLSAGTYTLDVTDNRAVSATFSFIVPQNPVISYTGGVIVSSTGSNGSISQIILAGGSGVFVSTEWSSTLASTLEAKTGLAVGSYTLTATDSVGGVGTFVFVVPATPPLQIVPGTVTHISVYGGSDGAIGATAVTGGLGALSLSWTPPLSGVGPFTGLTAGTYVLTVTDAQNTVASSTFVLGEPIFATISVQDQTRSVDGAATITSLGGIGSYSYAWTKDGAVFAGTLATQTELDVGVYKCTVTSGMFSQELDFVIATFMNMQAGATVLRAAWKAIPGVTAYKVLYGKTTDNLISFTNSTTFLSAVICGLDPLTEYRVVVLGKVGAVFRLFFSDSITTVQQVVDTHEQTLLQAGAIINVVPLGNGLYQEQKSVVLYIPDDENATSSAIAQQSTQLTLLDDTTTTLVYKTNDNSITIGSTAYTQGSVFLLDDEKLSVLTRPT